jgi:hypothetical protein
MWIIRFVEAYLEDNPPRGSSRQSAPGFHRGVDKLELSEIQQSLVPDIQQNSICKNFHSQKISPSEESRRCGAPAPRSI